ncbi:hypothetical protein D9757_007039 [Collybiopsis confluens]|uniref:UDENN domain-containing protein n=1 Tax=Collybiopsis confluens TaxID=2823264 RepID=A0A8H5M4S0_9AGAR|nr:hypothetical protein D9757_007039 [Collybiopsis confluens]
MIMPHLDDLTNSPGFDEHDGESGLQRLAPESDDGDTASQKSISLSSSPAISARNSLQHLDTDESSFTSSPVSKESPALPLPPTYPPRRQSDSVSVAESFASGSSKKARPESILLQPPPGKLVLGIALVDFNHLVGPRIEWSKGEVFEDEEIATMIPFLALPDGAHISAEDYSYFHIVPSGSNPTTLFGISCNQQIAASALLVRMPDVTRSTVQKAVVVLASKPVFGPIRDKLGVVTTALFHQRDFSEVQILDDFESGLELSLRTQMTESGLYMGTNLRELVHTFRQRTLVLVKALILQKRIMFYGHPVERLCTYQYSLISLLPGLLQSLDDCGSPPLSSRAPSLTRPTSLRTSDRKSLMAYTGLPLDIFGKDAFFQPYLPLQQLDMLKETKSWLCGSTNSIVTQQKEIDLFVNTETGAFEFRDQNLERYAGLTAADRKWMDDIIKDVNETWSEDDTMASHTQGLAFKGSDDYLRVKFDEYISAALAAVRYRDFLAKGEGVLITEPTSTEDFNHLWMLEFKNTNAYEIWERTTDPMLFDIIEPRHPCNEKVSVVADIGLRLQEGIQDLKLEQQLAPAREAVSRTLTAGSIGFFKAVEGVRERWQRGTPDTPTTAVPTTAKPGNISGRDTPEEPEIVNKSDLDGSIDTSSASYTRPSLLKHASVSSTLSANSSSSDNSSGSPTPARLSSWGAGIGSFMSSRVGRFSLNKSPTATPAPPPAALPLSPPPLPPPNLAHASVEPTTPTAKHASASVVLSSPPKPAVVISAQESTDERLLSPIDSLIYTLDTASEPDNHKDEGSKYKPAHVNRDSEDESDELYSGIAVAM